ncbi:MAG: pyrimidine dimer DNA glycosylase/endonuclease V [Chromatiales bacterium]|jgi:hypothetical protein
MRIWDINPGYLNTDLLLSEHRILHDTVAILTARKPGMINSQETSRWFGFGWALRQRHKLLVAEMNLRGYADITPVLTRSGRESWPDLERDEPIAQLQMLDDLYLEQEPGRIPLPDSAHQLWAQHKYSVLARNLALYRRIDKRVAGYRRNDDFADLALQLTRTIRKPPTEKGIRNALQQMWSHVSGDAGQEILVQKPVRLLREIQHRAIEQREPFLIASTALGELQAWMN